MKSQGLIEGGGHVNHRYVEEEAGFASLIRERERESESGGKLSFSLAWHTGRVGLHPLGLEGHHDAVCFSCPPVFDSFRALNKSDLTIPGTGRRGRPKKIRTPSIGGT